MAAASAGSDVVLQYVTRTVLRETAGTKKGDVTQEEKGVICSTYK